MDLLGESEKVLRERIKELNQHNELLSRLTSVKEKVRQQRIQIDLQWQEMWEAEAKEIESLESEKESVENQLKNEILQSSKESIAKSVLHEFQNSQTNKTNKFPPSKLGNYSIMAKRLQTEIKQLDQNVNEVKLRLQQELQFKNSLEGKVREIRNSIASQRKHESLTAATTPVQ